MRVASVPLKPQSDISRMISHSCLLHVSGNVGVPDLWACYPVCVYPKQCGHQVEGGDSVSALLL